MYKSIEAEPFHISAISRKVVEGIMADAKIRGGNEVEIKLGPMVEQFHTLQLAAASRLQTL
jgi:hypothetical protein